MKNDLKTYLASLHEGDNITVTADLLDAMEQAVAELEELEDKLEAGTLIELPNIIGVKHNWIVQRISASGVIEREFYRGKAKAEARLKELRGGNE